MKNWEIFLIMFAGFMKYEIQDLTFQKKLSQRGGSSPISPQPFSKNGGERGGGTII